MDGAVLQTLVFAAIVDARPQLQWLVGRVWHYYVRTPFRMVIQYRVASGLFFCS
jgi:hypothetical protein